MAKPALNARQLALSVLVGVVKDGQSTAQLLPAAQKQCPPRDVGLLQQLVMGSLQHWFGLQNELSNYLKQPLKSKDSDIQCLLSLGLFQLRHTRIPAHAAISETVNLCPKRKAWARGLCNAIFRRASQSEVPSAADIDLPHWLLQQLQQDWPEDWPHIAQQSSSHAELTLRATANPAAYIEQLRAAGINAQAHPIAANGISLGRGLDITQLPGFHDGAFVVQDGAAQLAAELLAPQDGERILDACAAPGGKTTHLVQLAPTASIVALDSETMRLQRVEENLHRLGQRATVILGDATAPATWWDGVPFDRILLDAPCSATGVIRRHPDIKLHRRAADIDTLVALQQRMLMALWPTLKAGGHLLYCTCSLLRRENSGQMIQFLAEHADAELVGIDYSWGQNSQPGKQLFPGDYAMDGFYYCLLRKRDSLTGEATK